jgi:hypothetical protein
MLDMFGNEITEKPPEVHGYYKKWESDHHYRPATEHLRSCARCKYCKVIEYHDKRYRKCSLLGISASEASDIRASGLCDLFE